MRGASVNFQKIHTAMHAVAHASRRVPPKYLLPAEHSLGTHVVIDDKGEVQKKLTEKMALASRQAKASKHYSPLWEGVINLPCPSKSITAEHQIQVVKEWCKRYESITGHKVLRADVHLDEGYVDASGKPQFNAHAHLMCDRTDAAGKVIKLSPEQLREVQGMTAEVTQLERGQDARKTRRQHLNHHQFRFAAEQGRKQLDQTKAGYDQLFDTQLEVLKEQRGKVKSMSEELAEAKRLADQYKAERDMLKASGIAKQADYQALKMQYEAAKAEVVEAKQEASQAKAHTAAAQEQVQKLAVLAEQYRQEREALKASGIAKQADYQALKMQYEAAKAEVVEAKQEAIQAKAQAAAVQEQLQKTAEIANKNREVALSYKAKLEVDQGQLAEAKAEVAQAQKELARTSKALLYEGAAHGALRRELEATKKRLEAAEAQKAPTPQPTPEKTLGERISASFEALLEWIKAKGSGYKELKPDGYYIGPIEKIDDLHAAMRVGLDDYVIHRLEHLSRPISMESNVEEIQYRDGRGYVKPQRDQGMDFGR